MMSKSVFVVSALLASVAVAGLSLAASSPQEKCASAKMKAAGKKWSAKAKCYAKGLAGSVAADALCLQKAEDKFLAAFNKADDKGGCSVEGDAAAIETKIDNNLDDVVGDLGCGNGVGDGDEACDDGNLIDGDGCSSTCQVEAIDVCGDGTISGLEECDDANTTGGDGCDATCTVEAGFGCTGSPSTCTTVCGDGMIAGPEQCDDANTADADGCSATCTVEAGFICSGVPSVCTPL